MLGESPVLPDAPADGLALALLLRGDAAQCIRMHAQEIGSLLGVPNLIVLHVA